MKKKFKIKKQMAKKLTSFVLTICIIITAVNINPVSVFADFENTHINIGDGAYDIVEVAKTQVGFVGVNNKKNKYTQWCGSIPNYPDNGFGYEWCQAFVGWCATNANISTDIVPRQPGTYTCKNFFTNRGLWHDSRYHGGSYSPKRGDIVYFQWDGYSGEPSHVGIVADVSGSTLYTIEGNTGGDKVLPKTYSIDSKAIQGYASPKYTINNIQYSLLSSNLTSIAVNEEITFYASSDCAQGYTIGIDNSDGRYITQEMPGGQLTLKFSEPGKYGAYVTSYNQKGYCDSPWITFYVYDTRPSSSFLVADKKIAFVGQDITFTATSDIATGYTIGIDNETERLSTQEMPNGSLTLSFDNPGEYSAYVTSYNSIGYADSQRVFFTVYNTPPTFSTLISDFDKVLINEPITFSAESDLANVFWIGINHNDERILTEQMPDGCFTTTFTEPGIYWAYVTSSNEYGYVDSKCISFNVYPSEEEKIYNGDCNNDGLVDNLDLVCLCQHLIKDKLIDSQFTENADINKDEIIDIADLAILKQYIMGDKINLN